MKKGFIFLCKAVATIGAIGSFLVLTSKYMSKKSKELESKNKGQKIKKYQICMDGKQVKISEEEVEEISVQCCMSGFVLDLTKAYIASDVTIKVQSLMSGVKIIVPPMVQVVYENSVNIMGGMANLVPTYEKEELPTIHIFVENLMGGISVSMQL